MANKDKNECKDIWSRRPSLGLTQVPCHKYLRQGILKYLRAAALAGELAGKDGASDVGGGGSTFTKIDMFDAQCRTNTVYSYSSIKYYFY